jgi:excisionase family DNA binding protein
MPPAQYNRTASTDALPALRFEIVEAAHILRMSRAQLYNRISDGALRAQKDGSRTYITRTELERYVSACGTRASLRAQSELDRDGRDDDRFRSP